MQLQEFEARRLTATEIESAVEYSIQAMEGITQREVEVTRDLTYRLVVADAEDESPLPNSGPDVTTALQALREKIRQLAKS